MQRAAGRVGDVECGPPTTGVETPGRWMKANRRAGRAETGPTAGRLWSSGAGRTAEALISAGRSSSSVGVRSYAAAAATLNINLLHRGGQSAPNRRESRTGLAYRIRPAAARQSGTRLSDGRLMLRLQPSLSAIIFGLGVDWWRRVARTRQKEWGKWCCLLSNKDGRACRRESTSNLWD